LGWSAGGCGLEVCGCERTKNFSPHRTLAQQAVERILRTASSSLHDTRTVKPALVQCECYIGK